VIAPAQKVYSYFPGCSLEATNKAYDISTRNVARVLGVEMVELEDWNCCGATAYLSIDENRAHVLATRNLALSEIEGRDLVTVCSGCYLVLHKANRRFQEEPELRSRIRAALQAGGMDYEGSVRVRHFLDVVVNDVGKEAVERHIVRRLDSLKVACYYGCQITRPYAEIDDAEFPEAMDRLMSWLGATAVDFRLKTKCCSGLLMTTQQDVGVDMAGKLLREARRAGANVIGTACPLCQMNLEAYQDRISSHMGQDCRIPILYFTQILGSALGLDAKELALDDSLTPVQVVLEGKGAVR
jgi:heterodisulfide reductase subunit B2